MVRYPAERESRTERRGRDQCRRSREREKEEGRGHSSTLSLVGGGGGFGQGEGQQRGKEKVEGGGEERDGGEGLVWLLSASHVSKPVLKNE